MNFKHLYYFWMTARTGGVIRAGQRLHLTPQTLSGQIKLLEERLGCRLFERQGRNIRLTDAGQIAVGYAEDIFLLGSQLEGALKGRASTGGATAFKVGIADSIPKSIAFHLLQPAVVDGPPARIICREGGLPALLGDLAVQRLDLVLSDSPMPAESNVKAISHRLGRSSLAIFGADCFHSGSKAPFPACLDGLPMLMPGSGSALRRKLDGWIGETSLSPRVVGEFDDWALMMTFGREGNGVFAAPAVLETQLLREHGVRPLGHLANVFDEFYAISIERNISHPSVHRIADAARGKQFEDARQLAH
ncbi:LysR family transcriptional activator of nhaA [Paraburkholderia sp. EB58]|jgi:LysR family transcriptional activator of nhaA|uniref:transcriptional activator NhaR n=1 Tax=Paraburkholderia sp. EB58 TaxID=3035125 RepID=UPI003D217888